MTDWSLVGGDPTPGYPDLVASRVSQLRVSEDAVHQVSDALARIAQGTSDADWAGECAEAMRDVIEGFRHDLAPIAESFLQVRHALGAYGAELADLQARARHALRRAEVAEARRQSSEARKRIGTDLLARQRQQLAANQRAEVLHGASSTVQNVVDPSAAAANAQESHRLARSTQATVRAVRETEAEVRRLDVEINDALLELAAAKRTSSNLHDEWDQLGRRTADQIEDALAQQLKNKSNLEKLGNRVMDDLRAITEFVRDPLHNLSLIRDLIDTVHTLLSKVSTVLAIAAVITGALGLPIAPFLAAAALVVGVAVLALSVTKLILDVTLYNLDYAEDGKRVVSRGDLVSGFVDVGMDALSVFVSRGAIKVFTAPSLSSRYIASGEVKLAMKKAVTRGTEKIVESVRDEVLATKGKQVLTDIVMPPATTHPRCTVVIPPQAIARIEPSAVDAPSAALAGGGGGW